MDKTDRKNSDGSNKDPNLSHLRPESAEIFRKMTQTESKRPLSSSMTLFYPGDSDDDTETVPAMEKETEQKPRVSVQSGFRNPDGSEVRRFKLSSVQRETPKPEHPCRSITFPDLTEPKTDLPKRRRGGQYPASQDEIRLPRSEEPRVILRQNGSREESPTEIITGLPDRLPSKVDVREMIMEVSELHKGYVKGKNMIPVLNGVDIQVKDGEFLAIVGQSGSGKSTLLHLMGTLDIPDSGTVHFDGQRIDNLPSRRRDYLRNHYIGMIFQFYHLIPEMTMIENVLAPLMIRESLFGYMRNRSSYIRQAKELLELVGLSHRIKHRPNELSGGEMQRTSIARALITRPRVLLADEPTGNLDSKTTVEIIKLLRSLNSEKKLTIIMVTHDMEQARDADRVVRLVDGRVADSFQVGTP